MPSHCFFGPSNSPGTFIYYHTWHGKEEKEAVSSKNGWKINCHPKSLEGPNARDDSQWRLNWWHDLNTNYTEEGMRRRSTGEGSDVIRTGLAKLMEGRCGRRSRLAKSTGTQGGKKDATYHIKHKWKETDVTGAGQHEKVYVSHADFFFSIYSARSCYCFAFLILSYDKWITSLPAFYLYF